MAMAARLALGALLLLSDRANAAPPPKVHYSCVATNQPWQVVHYNSQTKKTTTEDHDDWHVTCKREVNGKVTWQGELPLAHPTELPDALDALRLWMKEALRDAKVDVPQPQGELPKP